MPQKPDDSTGGRGRSRWLGFVQIGLILAVIAVALYFARAPERVERESVSALSAEAAKPVVSVIRPATTSQALTVEVTGSVGATKRTRLRSEVSGRVIWVSPKLRNGGSMEADETFVRIDPAEYELQVRAAEAAVREAEARVRIERARGRERLRAFVRDNPDAEISDWVRGRPRIAKAEARLMKAQAEVELARLQLDRTNISLPYASRVIASRIEVGELVGPALANASPSLGTVVPRRRIADRCADRAEGP